MSQESETRQELIKHLQNYVDNKGFNISYQSLFLAKDLLERLKVDENYLLMIDDYKKDD